MGLFDFLKNKSKQADTIIQQKIDRSECEINKTQIIVDLFAVSKEERDDSWTKSFYENVRNASFACGNPQILNGPDGFPYFILKNPEPYKPFESFCIENMKDDFLLNKGFGVVINPSDTSADWVFSYGDIINLYINKQFYIKTNDVNIENEVTIKKDEKVLLAQPSETFLPSKARKNLRVFLQSIGIKEPKIMMLCRTIEGQVIQELAFNIFREDFQTTEQLNFCLKQISWFLPRQYVVLSLPKDSNFNSNFADL